MTETAGNPVPRLELAHWAVTEGVNGPGRRFTVWVQGCSRGCPGCFNPGLQEPGAVRPTTPAALAREFAAAGPVDGVSLSGGEPFEQAAGLVAFLAELGAAGAEPTVVAFSGYTLAELRAGPPAWRALLARVDLLVDGPFQAARAEGAPPLAGSANQRRVPLSAAGAALLGQVDAAPGREVLVQVTADGEVVLSGFPGPELLTALGRG